MRFGISIDENLLTRFDDHICSKGYINRSEAIRDLLRDSLVGDEWKESKEEMVGVVSLVYDHDQLSLPKELTEAQHRNHFLIVSTTHVHLTEHNCLEVLILRGKGDDVRSLAEQLISKKGVKHGKFFMTTSGEGLP